MISRRALFFAVVAIVCVALVPVTPGEFRWVAWAAMGLALFWGALVALEDLSRSRGSERRERRP